jgi:hypothetical protein
MAKKKTAGTAPADTAAETTAPRRRTAAAKPTIVQPGVTPSEETPSADSQASVVSGPAASMSNGPTYDQIAEAAYLRYLNRGASDGRDFDDWLAAEQELKSR